MISKYQSRDIFPDNIYWNLVRFFLENPYDQYYQSEIAGKLRHKNGAIQPALKKLVKSGFLSIKSQKNKTIYNLNNQFPKLSIINQIIK